MTSYAELARRIRVPVGFVVAAVYLWLARPTWSSIATGAAIAIPGLLLRTAASGHVKKNQEVTRTGPYAYTRNPLYLGSVILVIGFGVASRNAGLAIALVIVFAALYMPVIQEEEKFLASKFPDYPDYKQQVPRLIPRARAAAAPGSFSGELYRKHREYNAALGTLGMMTLLAFKLLFFPR